MNASHIFISCMMADKTTSIIQYIQKYSILNKKILMFKYEKDDRFEKEKNNKFNSIKSHPCPISGNHLELYEDNINFKIIKSGNNLLKNKDNFIKNYDVLVIDEGQFFVDLPEFILKYYNDKIILISCLYSNFNQKPWPSVINSLHYFTPNQITFKSSVCGCGNDATITILKNKENIKDPNNDEIIGGSEIYKVICTKCYIKLK